MKDLLVGPDTIFLNLFRLDHTEFGVLLKWARDTGTQDDKNFTVWQKLMVFLHIIGHHVSYRNVSNRFRMSIATINRIFNEVLVALAHNLYDEFVTQPGPEYSLESDMRKALTLITKSGNYYDDATGVIETADEKWEEFERKYGDQAKAIRNKGIPWVESLMKQVWPDARPTDEAPPAGDPARGLRLHQQRSSRQYQNAVTIGSTNCYHNVVSSLKSLTQISIARPKESALCETENNLKPFSKGVG
ncbi:hypothetical protein E4U47_002485 [Claviceps purpurea]|nr:hypothetical protein E4U47_002485 [Claviceps purpurea]